jgi:hypothetical protein
MRRKQDIADRISRNRGPDAVGCSFLRVSRFYSGTPFSVISLARSSQLILVPFWAPNALQITLPFDILKFPMSWTWTLIGEFPSSLVGILKVALGIVDLSGFV